MPRSVAVPHRPARWLCPGRAPARMVDIADDSTMQALLLLSALDDTVLEEDTLPLPEQDIQPAEDDPLSLPALKRRHIHFSHPDKQVLVPAKEDGDDRQLGPHGYYRFLRRCFPQRYLDIHAEMKVVRKSLMLPEFSKPLVDAAIDLTSEESPEWDNE